MANEPDFVTPFVYEYTDAPWKTDDVITRIEQQTFSTKPDGIPGNDDLGATSGVYVWSALGLYPGVPGVGGFFLGTPMFPEASVHIGSIFGDSTLVITSEGSGPYVTAISLNGQPYNQLWLPARQNRTPRHHNAALHPAICRTHIDAVAAATSIPAVACRENCRSERKCSFLSGMLRRAWWSADRHPQRLRNGAGDVVLNHQQIRHRLIVGF